MNYTWNEFKSLQRNEYLSLESTWIMYNDIIYSYNISSGGKKHQNDTINLYVETDYVENYFE